MYGKVVLTNLSRCPLALSNEFVDEFELIEAIQGCKGIDELTRIVNEHSRFMRPWKSWKVESDLESYTRLKKVDTLGNVHYLLCYKKKEDNKMNGEDSSKKLEILAEIEDALANTITARNRMGCSENWYNLHFCLGQTFTKEELKSFSEEELERMLKLASSIGEGLY